jgi:hypothetical protein
LPAIIVTFCSEDASPQSRLTFTTNIHKNNQIKGRKTTMYENRIPAYLQLIQKLLECSNGEESQILNAHSDLLDPGLLGTIIAVAKQFDDRGKPKGANYLINVALQLAENLASDQQPTVIKEADSRYFI